MCGKTAVIRKVVEQSATGMIGFVTDAFRRGAKRIGFMIETLAGQKAVLAHRDIKGLHRIGRHGVSFENIDPVAVASMEGSKAGPLIVIDEI